MNATSNSLRIPYERQGDPMNTRACGAACLTMVYRSFGKDVPQVEIWPAISKVNRFGSLASHTHLMARDAVSRGLAAIAFQARHPIQALRLCREIGARAILNHRLDANSPAGHYSVMVDIDARDVVLHDPFFGPGRRIPHAELLELWQPRFPNSEIVGGVLIAIAQDPLEFPPCIFCHTPTPAAIACPNCAKPVPLEPGAVLGCLNEKCVARQWNYLCCPACDFMWNSSSHITAKEGPVTEGAEQAAGDLVEPASLDKALEAIDQFLEHVRGIPGVTANPDLAPQFTVLAGAREQLKAAFAEGLMHGRTYKDQVGAFAAAAAERGAALRQKQQEADKEGEGLDGVALGKALLKNLGFTQ